jgi:hypothetical protein
MAKKTYYHKLKKIFSIRTSTPSIIANLIREHQIATYTKLRVFISILGDNSSKNQTLSRAKKALHLFEINPCL